MNRLKPLLFVGIIFIFGLLAPQQVFAQSSVCNADINEDNYVDLSDYSLVAANFLTANPSNPRIDINGDNYVDLSDYSILAANFLTAPTGCTTSTATPLPSPPTLTNLLQNGTFESGNFSPWTGGVKAVTTEDKFSGTYSLKVTDKNYVTQNVNNLVPGKTYVLRARVKWLDVGTGWGLTNLEVTPSTNATYMINWHEKYQQGIWHSIAAVFTATQSNVEVHLGLWGDKTSFLMYFDDVELFEKPAQAYSPIITNATADVISGNAPLTVNFTASAIDYDGAVTNYNWDFDDGTTSDEANPSHTFLSSGTKNISLTVWDNENNQSTKNLTITVADPGDLNVSIQQPTSADTYSTTSATINLSGTATSSSSNIVKLVWDDINTDDAGFVDFTPQPSQNWTLNNLKLKQGNNEILLTVTDANGNTSTDRLRINRAASAPTFSNISASSSTIKVFDKYEVTFNIDSAADQPMFMYDPNPPVGTEMYNGVTVEGVITKPDGTQATHPAFYMADVTRSGNFYTQTTNTHWALRYAPQQTGTYQISLRATDKQGSKTVSVGSFTATAPDANSHGYVGVSSDDNRYFQYSDGSMYWPIGLAWGAPAGITADGIDMKTSIINFDRYWMGSSDAYSSRWSNWLSTKYPESGNEGAIPYFSTTNHYPGHELSMAMDFPVGWRIWLGWLAETPVFPKSNTTYQVKLRMKTQGITGPATAGQPYGIIVKAHGFWSIGDTAETTAMLSTPSWITPINGTHDWATFVYRFTTGSNMSSSNSQYFSIFMKNVTGGEAYIDQFSIRPVLADGSLGGELIQHSKADWHTYVDQIPMSKYDYQVKDAEDYDKKIRYVVHDKNDLLISLINNDTGKFSGGGGYYNPENTKATWLLKQWWRYLVARLSYSDAIWGWELNNEGPPDDGSGGHAMLAQIMAHWIHQLDAHPHLVSTSFWCCWEPTFWKDNVNFPDVDYADIHHYIKDPNVDMVSLHLQDAVNVANDQVGKPTIIGENGYDGDPAWSYIAEPNTGVWYHNMLWSQLHYSGLYEMGYWFNQHATGFSRDTMARPFYSFIMSLDLNKGGYQNIAATSDQSKFQIFGQKNLAKNKAHIWVHHTDNTWYNVRNNGTPAAVSGNVTFQMSPNTSYKVEYYNTYTGNVDSTGNYSSNSQGNLTIPFSNISQDQAAKVTVN